ncbi:MAG: hypothetical protein J7M09_02230 [Deltaproteobacteria bacterium]|nr:hypothetical protein [Candidatus Tharpella sp.]
MKSIESVYSKKKSGYILQGTIIFLDNNDVIVVITGGADHIGAVGLAIPRPSRLDPNSISATSSILTMLGHKEDELVKYVSEKLAAATQQNIIVIAGVHYDDLALQDLEVLRELWIPLTDRIIVVINRKVTASPKKLS